MRRFLLALLCLAALAAAAQDTKPLVDAAKDAKAKRKTSTTRVITNADVKKSAGKLAPSKKPAAAAKPLPPKPAPVDEDELYRQRRAADAALTEAQQKVTDLERELRAVEESFYNEDDPEVRDRVIAAKFVETSDRLTRARAALKAVSDRRSAMGDQGRPPADR
jgi:hypothetical protein